MTNLDTWKLARGNGDSHSEEGDAEDVDPTNKFS